MFDGSISNGDSWLSSWMVIQNMFFFAWWHPEAIYNALVCYLMHLCTDFPLVGHVVLFRLAPHIGQSLPFHVHPLFRAVALPWSLKFLLTRSSDSSSQLWPSPFSRVLAWCSSASALSASFLSSQSRSFYYCCGSVNVSVSRLHWLGGNTTQAVRTYQM